MTSGRPLTKSLTYFDVSTPRHFVHLVKGVPKAPRACYLHACLKRVARDYLTNASLRERFGIDEKNKAMVSRYIRESVEEGAIRPFDESAARRMMKSCILGLFYMHR